MTGNLNRVDWKVHVCDCKQMFVLECNEFYSVHARCHWEAILITNMFRLFSNGNTFRCQGLERIEWAFVLLVCDINLLVAISDFIWFRNWIGIEIRTARITWRDSWQDFIKFCLWQSLLWGSLLRQIKHKQKAFPSRQLMTFYQHFTSYSSKTI